MEKSSDVGSLVSKSSLAPIAPEHLGLKATLAAIIGGGTAYALGHDHPTCAAACGLAATSVRIAVIDLKLCIIPDRDIIAMTTIGLLWVLWIETNPFAGLANALLHGIGYSAFFQIVRLSYLYLRGRQGLGFGDVKLVAAAGPMLSIDTFSLAITFSAIAGIFAVIIRKYTRKRKISKYSFIPFGFLFAPISVLIWIISIS